MKSNFLDGKHILLAEDNPVNQMIVRHILENKGSILTIVENGKEVIEQLAHAQFDLILMDVQMPLMDGYETSGIIRNQLGLKIPIIAFTAHAPYAEHEKLVEFGLNGFIIKPFTIDSLCRSIESIMVPQIFSV